MGKDQSSEQSNKRLQEHGNDVGLGVTLQALTLFMIAGPECSRCIAEFEDVLDTEGTSMANHLEGRAFQNKFKQTFSRL